MERITAGCETDPTMNWTRKFDYRRRELTALRPSHATSGSASMGASRAEYRIPPPLESTTVRAQSSHNVANGTLKATKAANPTHHDRRWMPNRPKGRTARDSA